MSPRAIALLVTAILILSSGPAHAFRCGNRIVTENMHETEVRRACGTPASMRHIGRTLRDVNTPIRRRSGSWTMAHFPGYNLVQEVIITEYVYNFGPRKLMRRLKFEGGILVSIEALGYGHREK
jgi:hypothetical protein